MRGFLVIGGNDSTVIQVVPDKEAEGDFAVVAPRSVVDITADILDHRLQDRWGIDPPHRKPCVLAKAVGR